MSSSPSAEFDDRAVRVAQGVLSILLLAAFVFREPLVVPVAAAAEGIGAVFGPQVSPLHVAYRTLAGPRLAPGSHPVAPSAVRLQHVLAVGLLAVASLAFLVGVGLVGWLAALAEAGIAVVEATTGVNTATALRDRLSRD